MRFAVACFTLSIALGLVACSGGNSTGSGGDDGDGGSSSGSSGSSGSSSSSSPTEPLGPSCQKAEDCPNWFCECSDGKPVNARTCNDNHCASAADSCPRACGAFGATWTGSATGGWKSGSSSSGGSSSGGSSSGSTSGGTSSGGSTSGGPSNGCLDGTSYTDLGTSCLGPSECSAAQCIGTQQHAFCTKTCTTSENCPLAWVCAAVSGVTSKVCVVGDPNKTTPKSTNAACKARAFADVGKPCTSYTQCDTELCGGSASATSRVCTKRCNDASECPAGMSCFTGSGDTFKSCRK